MPSSPCSANEPPPLTAITAHGDGCNTPFANTRTRPVTRSVINSRPSGTNAIAVALSSGPSTRVW